MGEGRRRRRSAGGMEGGASSPPSRCTCCPLKNPSPRRRIAETKFMALALPRPSFRVFDQAVSHGIVSDVIPTRSVMLSGSQLAVPIACLPDGLLVRPRPAQRYTRFPILDPLRKWRANWRSRRSEKMEMIGKDDEFSHQPMIGLGPCIEQKPEYLGTRQQPAPFVSADRDERDRGDTRKFDTGEMNGSLSCRDLRMHFRGRKCGTDSGYKGSSDQIVVGEPGRKCVRD